MRYQDTNGINEETRQCEECQTGYYSDYTTNSKCIKCPKGTYCSNKGCNRCEKCYGNTYSSEEGIAAVIRSTDDGDKNFG